jgi:hypothetical protein
MFGRRRRPLARAAVVGGGAYAIGKRRARTEADDAYADEPVEAEPVEAESDGISDDGFAQLEKLGALKERGLLTQQEFDEQKAKILDAS